MNYKKHFRNIAFIGVFFWSGYCFAGYALEIENEELLQEEIIKNKAKKDYDIREHTKYGLKPFIGTRQEQKINKEAQLYKKADYRFYANLEASLIAGAIASHFNIKGIQQLNYDSSNIIASGYLPSMLKHSARGVLAHRGAAFGYQWRSFGVELEYVGTGKLNYSVAPPFVFIKDGIENLFPYSLNSDISAKALLLNSVFLNTEKELASWLAVQSYWKFGLGFGETKTVAATSLTNFSGYHPGSKLNKRRKIFALDLGYGARTRLTEHFFLDTRLAAYLWPKPKILVRLEENAGTEQVLIESRAFVSAAWLLGLTFLF